MAHSRWLASLALSLAALATASAEEPANRYPGKPIRFIVPASTGGPTDIIARLVAEKLSHALGQPVLVDNKPGASQMLGTSLVAKSEADGYTLLFAPSTPIVLIPFTTKSVPYDVKRDFTVVSHIGTTPLVLYAHAAVPAGSIKELVALAKARPGALSYGSWGTGSSGHLLGEYMSKQAGISLVHVPYKGIGPEITDLVGGQINFGVAEIGVPAPFVKSGQLKALAVSGKTRAAALPDVPTFAEQGIGGMEPFSPWWGVLAPAATPRPVVDKLSSEIVKIARSPDFASRLAGLGVDATGLSAADATAAVQDELLRWQKIVAALPDVKFD